MTDTEKYVYEKIQRWKTSKVTIIIGEAVDIFKKMYKDYYDTITTADDVRNFLAKWNTPYDKPIVFEDISLMVPRVQTFLLKFIEEPPAPLIIMASIDNVSPIILSRCTNIIKIPSTKKYGNKQMSDFVKDLDAEIDDLTTKNIQSGMHPSMAKYEATKSVYSNIDLRSLNECPDYLYKDTMIKSYKELRNVNDYLKLL